MDRHNKLKREGDPASIRTLLPVKNPARTFLERTYDTFRRQEFARQSQQRRARTPCIIDLTHPFFMYLSAAQGRSYESAITQPEFQAHLYAPIATLYEGTFEKIVRRIKSAYDYVDLGPGYASYLTIAHQHLFSRKEPRFYIPVDINLYLLNKLCRYTRQLSLRTVPINGLFELLPPQLEVLGIANGPIRRVFNLGLTFNNYTPLVAVQLIRSLLAGTDSMMICAESPESVTLPNLLAPYENQETEDFNRASVASLGVTTRNSRYAVLFQRGRIEMGFRITRDSLTRHGIPLLSGDFLRTCISHRHPMATLVLYLRRHFHTVSVAYTSIAGRHRPTFYSVILSRPKI